MLKDECETSLMIESYNDTCIEHFNKNKKIVVANSEDKFKQQCSHNMPPTAYLFDQLKSKFFNEMLDDQNISGEASKKLKNGYACAVCLNF